eukprot:gb/GECG01002532.1/.p1 GENE.gb/GECG01002532.1/~~gb/GECG01002532.1/.p1  ORF type:complete len:140 (+),score=25.23 gb/GECG01002532.1/:1-420(+)
MEALDVTVAAIVDVWVRNDEGVDEVEGLFEDATVGESEVEAVTDAVREEEVELVYVAVRVGLDLDEPLEELEALDVGVIVGLMVTVAVWVRDDDEGLIDPEQVPVWLWHWMMRSRKRRGWRNWSLCLYLYLSGSWSSME